MNAKCSFFSRTNRGKSYSAISSIAIFLTLFFGYNVDAQFASNSFFSPILKNPKANLNPNAPSIAQIDPIQVSELDEISFRISVSDQNGTSLHNNSSLEITAKDLPEGAIMWNSGHNFKWTPNIQQSGIYEITFIASNSAGSDRMTVTIAVFELARPYFALDTLYTRPVVVANQQKTSTYFIPILENIGGVPLTDVQYTVIRNANDSFQLRGNATIHEWEFVKMMDVDGNGCADLLFAHRNRASHQWKIVMVSADRFCHEEHFEDSIMQTGDPQCADVDGDGKDELIFASNPVFHAQNGFYAYDLIDASFDDNDSEAQLDYIIMRVIPDTFEAIQLDKNPF